MSTDEALPLRLVPAPEDDAASGASRAGATLAALHGGRPGLGALLSRCARQFRQDCASCPRPIGAQCGALMYQIARLSDVRLAVLLGAGDPAVAIWLACALRANCRHAGDRGIIACEPEHAAAEDLRRQLRLAGVSRYVDLREGAPGPALAGIDQPVDCVVLNGRPPLMLQVLRQLQSRLRSGAMVLALRPAERQPGYAEYLDYVRRPGGPFTSITLPYREAVELSVRS
jgi:predicted O-methyltransferase YrrM